MTFDLPNDAEATSSAGARSVVFASLKARVPGGNFHLGLSIGLLTVSYVLYVFLQKYRIYYIGWAACAFVTLYLLLGGRLRAPRTHGGLRILLAFWLYIALGAFWSFDPRHTLLMAAYFGLFPIIFWISAVWTANVERWSLSTYFTAVVVGNLLIAVVSIYLTGAVVNTEWGAMRSTFALAFTTALPLLIWRVLHRPGLVRYGLVLAAAGLALSVGSRSALIILPLVGGLVLISHARRRRTHAPAVVLGLATILVLPLTLLASPGLVGAVGRAVARFGPESLSVDLSTQIERQLSGGSDAVDVSRRLQAFVALRSFLDRPLIGGGFGSTYAQTTTLYGREVSAHGLPFVLLGELGLVGTLLFSALIVGFLRQVARKGRNAPSAQDRLFWTSARIALIGMLIFGLFHQIEQYPSFYVLLGWGYADARS